MISLIAESLHFPHLFAGNSLQPEITPNSKMCLEEARFFSSTPCACVVQSAGAVLRGQPKSIQFQFCFCALWIRASRRCSLQVPGRPEITACYWHETSFPLSHMMSIEQRFFTEPRAKLLFNFNVYQNSNREETDRELQVKQFDTAGVPRTSRDQAFQTTAPRQRSLRHLHDFMHLVWPSSGNLVVVMRDVPTLSSIIKEEPFIH